MSEVLKHAFHDGFKFVFWLLGKPGLQVREVHLFALQALLFYKLSESALDVFLVAVHDVVEAMAQGDDCGHVGVQIPIARLPEFFPYFHKGPSCRLSVGGLEGPTEIIISDTRLTDLGELGIDLLDGSHITSALVIDIANFDIEVIDKLLYIPLDGLEVISLRKLLPLEVRLFLFELADRYLL